MHGDQAGGDRGTKTELAGDLGVGMNFVPTVVAVTCNLFRHQGAPPNILETGLNFLRWFNEVRCAAICRSSLLRAKSGSIHCDQFAFSFIRDVECPTHDFALRNFLDCRDFPAQVELGIQIDGRVLDEALIYMHLALQGYAWFCQSV